MFRIGELASQFGLSRSTLLYYHRIGLLIPSGRNDARYRLYSGCERERLESICSLRQAGLGIEEIRTMLAAADSDTCAVVRRRLLAVGREIQALQIKQSLLAGMLKVCGQGGPTATVDKEMFVALLRAVGMDDGAMLQLHAEFERRAPQAHHSFLLMLGIPEKEALLIRKRSAKGDGSGIR